MHNSFKKYDRVIFIHSIGVDKFENQNYPNIEVLETIDKEVYHSNVNTYKYLAASLVEKLRREHESGSKTKLTLSMIGSVADKHGIIFLTSFTESKHIVRSYIRTAVERFPWVISGLIINISSTVTKSALKVRPHADTTYWLKPEETVDESLPALLDKGRTGYKEIDIYKEHPEMDENYYRDPDKIFKRWSKFAWGENEKRKRK